MTRSNNGGRAPSAPSPLSPGDAFNPYRLFNGPVIPYAVLGMAGISDGAKLLYGVLAMNMAGKGECAVFRRTLAEQLATSEPTIGRWLNELTKAGLIQTRKQGPNAAAKYRYQWREELRTCLRKDTSVEVLERSKLSVQPPPRKRSKLSVQQRQNDQNCTPERSDLSVHERSNLIGPYKEYENSDYENSLRESSSFEESASVAGSASPEPDRTDDDEPSLEVLELEPVKPEGSQWEPTGDEFEAARDCLALHRAGYGIREQATNAFLDSTGEQSEAPAITNKPDAAITRKVVAHFRDAEDFMLWITDLAGRFSGSKVKSWGFYATDAGNWNGRRPDILAGIGAEQERRKAIEQAAEERRRRDEQEAEELQRVEAACRRKGWKLVSRSTCPRCAGYGRNPENEAICPCPAGDSLRHCQTCNNAGTITTWPAGVDRKNTPPLESWCTCEHAERLKAERGADYCDRKNAEAWSSLRHQRQSDQWDELYRAHKPILKLIPGFNRIEVGFACSDDEAERAELLERFAQGIARCSASEGTFRSAAA